MIFDMAGANNLDFTPCHPPIDMLAYAVAEATIVRTIVEGSGGTDNAEITEASLRFIRHLLSQSYSTEQGSLPNFRNMETIQEMARDFMRQYGTAAAAIQAMYNLMQV